MSSSHEWDTVDTGTHLVIEHVEPIGKTAGQVACDAWAASHVGGVDDPIFGHYSWAAQSPHERTNWEAASAAVLKHASGG